MVPRLSRASARALRHAPLRAAAAAADLDRTGGCSARRT
jgi:hypothetical protein